VKLNVEALAARTTANPGDPDRAAVALSVTHEDGKAVLGLTAAHVFVQAIVAAPGGAGVALSAMSSSADGFYAIDVIPAIAGTWRPGRYLLAIVVARGFDRGQGLAELLID
jgi:hypothetical protein